MATVSSRVDHPAVDYPTSDGRPMAETEDHRDLLFDSIYTLKMHPRTARQFYVSGNLLMYYEEGNKHKHVSPDVFAVPKSGQVSVRDSTPPADKRRRVEMAVKYCPTHALKLVED